MDQQSTWKLALCFLSERLSLLFLQFLHHRVLPFKSNEALFLVPTQNIRFWWHPVFDGITFNRKFRFLKKFKEDLHLTVSFALVGFHGSRFLCVSKRIGVRLFDGHWSERSAKDGAGGASWSQFKWAPRGVIPIRLHFRFPHFRFGAGDADGQAKGLLGADVRGLAALSCKYIICCRWARIGAPRYVALALAAVVRDIPPWTPRANPPKVLFIDGTWEGRLGLNSLRTYLPATHQTVGHKAVSLSSDLGQGALNVGAVAFDMIIAEACGPAREQATGVRIDADAISYSGRMGKEEKAAP
jgi:hypothetical protein